MECKRCGKSKGLSEFYRSDTTCKVCRRALVKEYRKTNAEKIRKYDKGRANLPHRVEARKRYSKTDAGKASHAKSRKRWLAENPNKRAAHVILGNAVRDKRVERAELCESCGGSGKLHGHHDDYGRPLEVRWLCNQCHIAWHAENGEAKNG